MTTTPSAPPATTADRILDVAEALAQTRGFNGFSYADISDAVGITKASLHYHFRTKADLGRALISRYHVQFRAALERIDGSVPCAADRLDPYVSLYAQVMRAERMCLCGMLAAEYTTLPEPMQDEIRAFFDMNEEWLSGVVTQGRSDGDLAFSEEPREVANFLLGALEGAMLVARSYGDIARFEASARRLIASLRASH